MCSRVRIRESGSNVNQLQTGAHGAPLAAAGYLLGTEYRTRSWKWAIWARGTAIKWSPSVYFFFCRSHFAGSRNSNGFIPVHHPFADITQVYTLYRQSAERQETRQLKRARFFFFFH